MFRKDRLLPIACLLFSASIILPKIFDPSNLLSFVEGFLQGLSIVFFVLLAIIGTDGYEKFCAFKKKLVKTDA